MLGTLPYASPEQAASQAHLVTPASDVWALGVMLYELLTGGRPFVGTAAEVALAILSGRYVPPEQARPGLPRGLAAVVRRCLELRPERRYPTAAELADDLARWLRGEEPAARRRRGGGRGFLLFGAAGLLAVGLALTPLRPGAVGKAGTGERPSPAGANEFHNLLAAGRPVRLLGATGAPAHFRAVSDPPLVLDRGAAGDFVVHSPDLCPVELLGGVRLTAFRLRVEVRHLRPAPTGEVGLFFWHSRHGTAGRPQFFHAELLLNDHAGARPRRVGLTFRRFTATGPDGRLDSTAGAFAAPVPGQAPTPGTLPPWRRLAVVVTPEGALAYCDGALVQRRTRAEAQRHARAVVSPVPPPEVPPFFAEPLAGRDALGLLPPFPTGAVGLVVRRGSAAFRNAVLEPLSGPDDTGPGPP
jgi:hypothetical protein